MTATGVTARRPRRLDPARRDRIVDVTLDVIAEHGVRGTTHRTIAAAADVPLGSLTYHFTGRRDLLEQAFRRHAERMAADYESHFRDVRTRADLVEAVTALVHGTAGRGGRDAVISFELYLAALRDPSLRSITEDWMAASRRILRRHLDAVTARGLDALIEGLILHTMLSTDPMSRARTREYVERELGPADVRPSPEHPAPPPAPRRKRP